MHLNFGIQGKVDKYKWTIKKEKCLIHHSIIDLINGGIFIFREEFCVYLYFSGKISKKLF